MILLQIVFCDVKKSNKINITEKAEHCFFQDTSNGNIFD